ncbi:hypothetical protein LOD99_8295 [Oopsacas minuta]|uniref:Uncharacterized protein n=1 Tax=Oopsacas minuta TaxID=111878 RepID=A0AAV7JGN9_9METZ|nr:hypothetical protein LOD99_8295 [Oopsacas minuta]
MWLFEWPTKVYHLENVTNDWVMKKPHLSSLCEKCRNDGVHCLTGFSLKPDTEQPHRTKLHNEYNDEYRNRYMIHFGKQLNLVKHDIIIEPLFIQDLFDCLWVYLSREERSEFKNALNIAAAKWEQKNSGNLVRMCRAVLRQTQ